MNDLLKQATRFAANRAIPTTRDLRGGAMMNAAQWAAGKVLPRRRQSRSEMLMKGLAAAAVAVPLGLWVGSRMRSGRAV